jgi:hypothetical protein
MTRRLFPVLLVIAALLAAWLYDRVAGNELGGIVAVGVELVLSLTLLSSLQRYATRQIRQFSDAHSPTRTQSDAEASAARLHERVQNAYSSASNVTLASGMAGSAFLLLYYSAGKGGGVSSLAGVAPKAFVATGFAVVCATMMTAHYYLHVSALLEAAVPQTAKAQRNGDASAGASGEDSISPLVETIERLISVQCAQVAEMQESNALLTKTMRDAVDDGSGDDRARLGKELSRFRKGVSELRESVDRMTVRLNSLASQESEIFDGHLQSIAVSVGGISRELIDRVLTDSRTAAESVKIQLEAAFRASHEEDMRLTQDFLKLKFDALLESSERAGSSLNKITADFNSVITSLESLASSFNTSSVRVVESAGVFRAESERLTRSVSEVLATLETPAGNATLLTPLSEAATTIRKAAASVALDLKHIDSERSRLGKVRRKLLDLLPAEERE